VQIEGQTGGKVSTTAATMTGSISPTTSVTITGTVTGQGSTAPTGGIIIFSSGYQVGSAGFSSASGDVSNFSITLNSQTLFQGANFITLQYSGDATYYPSAVVLSSLSPISNPLSDFTLVPQTTIVPVTAGSSGTDTINLASAGGFNGSVSLTCKAAPGINCTISPSASLTSGGSATATLTVNAQADTPNQTYNVLITGTDSTGNYVHTAGVSTVVSGSAAGSSSFALTANPASITLIPGATTGNTSTVTVTPLGGFTGAVAMSCAVTASPTSATSPVTCGLASSSIASGAGTDVMTATTTATTTPGAYAVTVTGTSDALTLTAVIPVNVGSFTLGSNPASLTLSPGATTGNTSAISLTPLGEFTGTVTLSCSVSGPSGATDPGCSLSQSSYTASGTVAQTAANLTISSTAPTTSLNQTRKLFWPSAGGAALALVLFFAVPRRRRNWLAMLGLLVLFVSVAGLGCGGGGSSSSSGGGGGNSGTTAGAYTVTVTGTSGSITQTTQVSVTIN
jgi:hypothetical protein